MIESRQKKEDIQCIECPLFFYVHLLVLLVFPEMKQSKLSFLLS
jgi:hypothetical protein